MGLLDFVKKIPTANEMQGGIGEQLTKLMSKIDMPETLVLHDVLIDAKDGNTSQIDLLLIGLNGIYVVEVKHFMDAKIYGDCKKDKWFYYKGKNKYSIYSPYMQNQNHIKYLKAFLNEFGDVPCFSVIVMICDDFKVSNVNEDANNPTTVIVSGLLSLRKAVEAIAKGKSQFFTEEEKQKVYEYIKNKQYIGKDKRQEHKERVIALKQEKENIEKNNLCPFCKSPLVLRKGKNGEFYGCSTYPKCKFTKKAK